MRFSSSAPFGYNKSVIKVIQPIGFCYGVRNSIKKAREQRRLHKDARIVFLHPIVHNRETHEELLKEIKGENYDPSADPKIYDNALIVTSAHGSTAEEKRLVHYLKGVLLDCTCPFLITAKKTMKAYLDQGYAVYFIGNEKHAETLSVLSSDPRIRYIPTSTALSFDFRSIPQDAKIAVFPQSTLSRTVYESFLSALRKSVSVADLKTFPLCHECANRWDNALKIPPDERFSFFVIGDPTSSNAREFVNLVSQNYPNMKVFLTSSLSELETQMKEIDFRDNVYLASATSASSAQVRTFYKRLKKENRKKKFLRFFRFFSFRKSKRR